MRLIDADALMATLGITDMDCDKCAWYDKEWSNCKRGGEFEDVCCAIEHAPTIEPEQMIGTWSYVMHYGERYRVCKFCNAERKDDHSTGWNFCPHCGARMQEGEEHGQNT